MDFGTANGQAFTAGFGGYNARQSVDRPPGEDISGGEVYLRAQIRVLVGEPDIFETVLHGVGMYPAGVGNQGGDVGNLVAGNGGLNGIQKGINLQQPENRREQVAMVEGAYDLNLVFSQ